MRIIALILAFATLMTLVGCKSEKDYEKDIIFTEDVPTPEESYLRAEEVFFGLLLSYAEQSGTSNPSEKLRGELRQMAKDLAFSLRSVELSPEGFDILLSTLSRDGEAVINELSSSYEGYPKARALYLDLSAHLGADSVCAIIYEALLVYYDTQYEDYLEDYEKYGYGYLLLDAEATLERRRTLAEEIGREAFCDFAVSTLALGELLFGEGLATGYDGFTNEELLLFISSIDLDFDITEGGWEYLIYSLTYMSGPLGEDIADAMDENRDIALLAAEAEEALAFLRELQAVITANDLAFVREGRGEMAISLAFARLSDEGWMRFKNIAELPIAHSVYEELLLKEYGEEYSSHADSICSVDFTTLRAMAGGEEFYEGLIGYLGGISPAYSFGIER